MTDPALHVLAGPNGAGKSTFFHRVLEPATHLRFVNADILAAERWPGDEEAHGHAASELAADERRRLLEQRSSFCTETVFSHESKVGLIEQARDLGYRTTLHAILVPVEVSVRRVVHRVAAGGHSVPEDKIRSRYERLWAHVAAAIELVDEARVYDNTLASAPYRLVAVYLDGLPTGTRDWPRWTPDDLRNAGR